MSIQMFGKERLDAYHKARMVLMAEVSGVWVRDASMDQNPGRHETLPNVIGEECCQRCTEACGAVFFTTRKQPNLTVPEPT